MLLRIFIYYIQPSGTPNTNLCKVHFSTLVRQKLCHELLNFDEFTSSFIIRGSVHLLNTEIQSRARSWMISSAAGS